MAIQHKPLDGHIVDLHLDRQYVHGDHVGFEVAADCGKGFLTQIGGLGHCFVSFHSKETNQSLLS
jgi:hypothetical protein